MRRLFSKSIVLLVATALLPVVVASANSRFRSNPVQRTADGVSFVRTPEQRFEGLPQFPFPPQYVDVDGLRLHYVDVGPTDGEVVLLIHGHPAWSYLFRDVISALAAQGYRVVAPDLMGMGRSDKPLRSRLYTLDQHADWLMALVAELSLENVSVYGQGVGGIIAMRMLSGAPDRFARVAVSNTRLPLALEPGAERPKGIVEVLRQWIGLGTKAWRFGSSTPGAQLDIATLSELTEGERAAYDAPYPTPLYTAALRSMRRVARSIRRSDPEIWRRLSTDDVPFLTVFGGLDPVLGSEAIQDQLIDHFPGAEGEFHARVDASHFVPEDAPEALQVSLAFFLRTNPIGGPTMCFAPDEPDGDLDCESICERVSECGSSESVEACRLGCEFSVGPYLKAPVAEALEPCMLARSCSQYGDFQELLDGCFLTSVIGASGGSPVPDPVQASACASLSSAASACDPSANIQTECIGLSLAFAPETIEEITACAAAPCDEMRSCLLGSYCGFLFSEGVLPQ